MGPDGSRSYLLVLLVNPGKGPPSLNQNWRPMHVAFRFGAEAHRKELAGLKARESVEVEGMCKGRIGAHVTCTDCKIFDGRKQ
ncbi:MAG TPA: hypothetical protein VKD90_11025 [Gemmataceae bacterium]|nr:hypothetical protein [Gemmataceae bacterium]